MILKVIKSYTHRFYYIIKQLSTGKKGYIFAEKTAEFYNVEK